MQTLQTINSDLHEIQVGYHALTNKNVLKILEMCGKHEIILHNSLGKDLLKRSKIIRNLAKLDDGLDESPTVMVREDKTTTR